MAACKTRSSPCGGKGFFSGVIIGQCGWRNSPHREHLSSRAVLGKTSRTVYAAAKAGLIEMTRTWCLELAADGITVNVVAPGPVATELLDRGHPAGSEKRQRVIDSVPVKRVGTRDGMAHAVLYLRAPESGYIAGQTLFVCGGVSVSGSGGE